MTDVGNAQASAAVSQLVTASTWTERAAILEASSEALLSDAADGILAVLRWAYGHDRAFQERLDQTRWLLDLAGGDRLDGSQRPLAEYFKAPFADDGPYGGPPAVVEPPTGPPGDEQTKLLTRVVTAFVFASSWDERRNICRAYPTLFSTDEPAELARAIHDTVDDSSRGVYKGIIAFLDTVHETGLDAALADTPAGTFLRRSVAVEPELTVDEAIEFALIKYLDTPTWRRRRRVLIDERDLLFTDSAAAAMAALVTRYESDPEMSRQLVAAQESIARARMGIDGFADGLPPAVVALDADAFLGPERDDGPEASLARQISAARRIVNFLGPGIPWAWAAANYGLAGLLTNHPAIELRAIYGEEAAVRVSDALGVFTPDMAPDEWRDATERLGEVLVHRIRGDQAANIELAIGALERILPVDTAAGHVDAAARVAIRLSQAYRVRRAGVHASNLETAYDYGVVALRVFTRERTPDDWAWACTVLGAVAAERLLTDQPASRRQSIELAEAALTVLDARSDAKDWAAAHQLAGSVYAMSGDPGGPDFDRAKEHFEAALTVFGRETWPWQWAAMQHSLGVAYLRQRGATEGGRASALQHLRNALEVFTADYPWDRRRTLREIGGVVFQERDWEATVASLSEAAALGTWLEDRRLTPAGRYAEIGQLPNVYERLAYSLLKLGRFDEATLQLDLGKTRFLRDSLEGGAIAEPEGEPSINDMLELARPGEALVAPILTSQGSAVLVLAGGQPKLGADNILWLDTMTDATLRDMLVGSESEPGWLRVNDHVLRARDFMGVTAEHDGLAADVEESSRAQAELEAASRAWDVATSELGSRIWDVLVGPISDRLAALGVTRGSRLLVLPSKWLALVPLAAAWREVDGVPRYAIDDFEFVLAPSAMAAAVSRRRMADRSGLERSIAIVADPTGDLPFSLMEAEAVERLFTEAIVPDGSGVATSRVRLLPGSSASRDRVVEEAIDRTHLHFACHAWFDWFDPSGSALILADREPLSVSQIASTLRLDTNQLIALSACDTGVVETEELPNEYLGFPGALLQGGAAAVISTLWSVDDEATAVLMTEFYEHYLKESLEVGAALRRAQIALRDGTPRSLDLIGLWSRAQASGNPAAAERLEFYRAHLDEPQYNAPYYWAAFTYTGS